MRARYPVTTQVSGHSGSGLMTEAEPLFAGIRDQDDHVIRHADQRQGVMNGTGRLARAIPGDDDAPGRQRAETVLRHHQCWTPSVHEGCFDEHRLVGTAVCLIRFADDNKIGITGVAGKNRGQALQRTDFPACFERDCSTAGQLAGRSQHRIGLGFRVAQMFTDDIGRQVITGDAPHKRLGDQKKGGEMRFVMLRQHQGRLQADLRRRRLIDLDHQILDRHVFLHSSKLFHFHRLDVPTR